MLHKCLVPDQEYLGTGAPYHKTPRISKAPPCGRDHRPQHLEQCIDGPSWSTTLKNDTATLSALDGGTSYNPGRYCEAPEESLREEATDCIEELFQELPRWHSLSWLVVMPVVVVARARALRPNLSEIFAIGFYPAYTKRSGV